MRLDLAAGVNGTFDGGHAVAMRIDDRQRSLMVLWRRFPMAAFKEASYKGGRKVNFLLSTTWSESLRIGI